MERRRCDCGGGDRREMPCQGRALLSSFDWAVCTTVHCALYTVRHIRFHASFTLYTVVQDGFFIINYLYIMMCRVKCEHGASFDRRNRFCSTGLFHIARDTVGKYPLIRGWSIKLKYLSLVQNLDYHKN